MRCGGAAGTSAPAGGRGLGCLTSMQRRIGLPGAGRLILLPTCSSTLCCAVHQCGCDPPGGGSRWLLLLPFATAAAAAAAACCYCRRRPSPPLLLLPCRCAGRPLHAMLGAITPSPGLPRCACAGNVLPTASGCMLPLLLPQVVEVQEEFAIGLGEVHRARAAEKVCGARSVAWQGGAKCQPIDASVAHPAALFASAPTASALSTPSLLPRSRRAPRRWPTRQERHCPLQLPRWATRWVGAGELTHGLCASRTVDQWPVGLPCKGQPANVRPGSCSRHRKYQPS